MADADTVLSMPTAIFVAQCSEYIKGRVLDVGCGRKPYKRLFPQCEWVGVDIAPYGEIRTDAHTLEGIEDESFDTVVCTEMLHECMSPVMVFQAMYRVLKPGGFLVLSAPNIYPEDTKSLWGFKVRVLDMLTAQAGFKGVGLNADGRIWKQEWSDFYQHNKYGYQVPPEMEGWLADMDKRYPSISVLVARKEDSSE